MRPVDMHDQGSRRLLRDIAQADEEAAAEPKLRLVRADEAPEAAPAPRPAGVQFPDTAQKVRR